MRYEHDYDNIIGRALLEYIVSDDMLVEQESALRNEETSNANDVRNKLAPRKEEPFKLVVVDSKTSRFMCDGLKNLVPKNHAVSLHSWSQQTKALLRKGILY